MKLKVLSFVVGVSLALINAGSAYAHVLLADPRPRDNSDEHKNDARPCPARTMAQPVGVYQTGATIPVKFNETVTHPGCFVVDFSPGGDTGWTMLGTVRHSNMPPAPTRARPRPYETSVTLPAGVKCESCTLRVRQIMLSADPPMCPPATVPAGATYYQCANISIRDALGDGGPPDSGSMGGASGADGGARDSAAGGAGGTGGGGRGGTGGSGGTSGGGTTGGAGGSPGGSGGSLGTGGSPGGNGGSTGTGGTPGGTGGAAGNTTPPRKPDPGGCAVGAGAAGGAPVVGVLLAAALGVISARRRRRD